MSDINRFLAETEWDNWTQTPIAGDASRRSYRRMTGPSGQTAILMIAPPELGEDLRPFIKMADHLRGLGLTTPEILACDIPNGLAVISDLGPDHYAKWLSDHVADELALYQLAKEAIDIYAAGPVPDGLSAMTARVATDLMGLYTQFYAPHANATAISERMHAALVAVDAPLRLSLRDFHAENLIWRPSKTGLDRIGLLDFQDALLAHPVYDLVSLLRDARRDVSPETVEALTENIDPAAFAVISVQRNLRILGIFARLIHQDGKEKYRAFVPRVQAYVKQDLSHPILADLAPLILPDVP